MLKSIYSSMFFFFSPPRLLHLFLDDVTSQICLYSICGKKNPIKIRYNQRSGTRGLRHLTIQDFPMIMVQEQPTLNPLRTNNIVRDK